MISPTPSDFEKNDLLKVSTVTTASLLLLCRRSQNVFFNLLFFLSFDSLKNMFLSDIFVKLQLF